MSTLPAAAPGRYVPWDWQRWAHVGGCRWCGRVGSIGPDDSQMHREAACMACWTTQCSTRGECAACLYGWLPGWSRSAYRRDQAGRDLGYLCGYKGCSNEAVANAPRVGRVCRQHLSRPKLNGRPLVEVIEENRREAVEWRGSSAHSAARHERLAPHGLARRSDTPGGEPMSIPTMLIPAD